MWMALPLIVANSLSFAYGQTTVLKSLDFTLEAGSSYSMVGPSGCGKSTLLALLAGLLRPSSGQLQRYGLERPGATAVVLQDYGLFPWKKVGANIRLGLKLQGHEQDVAP